MRLRDAFFNLSLVIFLVVLAAVCCALFASQFDNDNFQESNAAICSRGVA